MQLRPFSMMKILNSWMISRSEIGDDEYIVVKVSADHARMMKNIVLIIVPSICSVSFL